MAKLAYFEFTVIFDPAETWTTASEFDTNYAAFLTSQGLEGEIIAPVGATTRRVIKINKLPTVLEPVSNQPVKSPGASLDNLAKPRGFDGKFRKPNV